MNGEEWTVRLPSDVSEELRDLPQDRVNKVVSDALREALDLAKSAENKRDELRQRMGIGPRDSEELSGDGLTDVEAKQEQLHQKRREGR